MTKERGSAVERIAAALNWLWQFSKAWLSRILSFTATIATAIWAAFGVAMWTSGVWLFVVAVGCGVGGLVAEFFLQKPTYMEQAKLLARVRRKAKRQSQALTRSMVILLRELSRYCEVDGHTERVTLYYLHDGAFFSVARRAQNPQYNGQGRKSYPIDQGYIGQAWDDDHGIVLGSMPAGTEAWNKAARKLGYSDEEIAGMRMRSRSISAIRLERSQGSIGVLVMESMKPKRHTMDLMEKARDSHVLAAIKELLAEFAMMTPAGEEAKARRNDQTAAERPWTGTAPAKPPKELTP